MEGLCNLDFLVVEDMSAVRYVLTKTLRRLGVKGRIDEARDGVEAWAMIQDHNFDIIICDIHMPRMNGLELKKLMRANPRFRETPFLMVSGEVNEDTLIQAIESEFDGYLSKPFRSAMLEKRLVELWGGDD
jgi:two-component system chemotaxis response regulator CheY